MDSPQIRKLTNNIKYLCFSTHLLSPLSKNSETLPGLSDCKYSEVLVAVKCLKLSRNLSDRLDIVLETYVLPCSSIYTVSIMFSPPSRLLLDYYIET